MTSDLHWGKSAVVSNEIVHCDVLTIHVDIDPLANCSGHHVRVLVVVELRDWGGGEMRQRERGRRGKEQKKGKYIREVGNTKAAISKKELILELLQHKC